MPTITAACHSGKSQKKAVVVAVAVAAVMVVVVVAVAVVVVVVVVAVAAVALAACCGGVGCGGRRGVLRGKFTTFTHHSFCQWPVTQLRL